MKLSTSPRLTGALLSLLIPVLASAQESGGAVVEEAPRERWFKVELLVLANEVTGADSAEHWPATPDLSYPEEARFLVDESLYASRAREFGGYSSTDTTGRQWLSDDEPAAATGPGFPAGTASPTTTGQDGTLPAAGATPQSTVTRLATPTPFVALARTEREFDDKTARLQRSGRYRVLFHEAWVQPVLAEGDALPIILDRSGDNLSWPRLQGSIRFHLSRYLHAKTDLWLNTAGNYLPGDWRMPAPPLAPASLFGEDLQGFEEKKLALAEKNNPPAPVPPVVTPLPDTEAMQPAQGAFTEVQAGPIYPWRHAVLLQQSRRMRSGEVHYIDHPMLGVVVKFTRLEEEDLELLAEAEAALP